MKKSQSKSVRTDKEIQEILKPYNEEIKRHIGALMEDSNHKLSAVAEQYIGVRAVLDSHTEMIGNLMEDIGVMKSDISFIKSDLKRKADFSLEKRVSILELKVKR